MEYEDEHPLQGVEDGEEVRHHDGRVVQEEQAEGPRQPQQAEKGERSQHPRPAKERRQRQLKKWNSTTAVDVIFVRFDVSLLPDSSLSIKIKLKNRSMKAKPPFYTSTV